MKRTRPSGFGGRFRLTLLLATVAAFILVPAAQALAAEEHLYIAANSIIDQIPEESACGVVTDSHGDIYVPNYSEKKVLVYSPTGATKITEFEVGFSHPCSLAVDSAGAVYVEEYAGQVDKYKPTAFPPTGSTTYALEATAGESGVIVKKAGKAHSIAVDPANQDLYVAAAAKVSSYESTGKLISATIGEGLIAGASYNGVGVYGSNGDVYVTDTAHNRVDVLNPAGTAVEHEITGSGSPAGVFETGAAELYTLAVDQSNGDFYVYYQSVHANSSVVEEFNASGGYVSQIGNKFDSEALALSDYEDAAVAVDNGSSSPDKGDVYVTSRDQAHVKDSVYAFGPAASASSDMTVGIEGTGAGEVTSLGTFAELEGEPPIACSYASPGPATGTCKDEMTYSEEEGIEGIDLKANPPAGSEVAEWRIENGSGSFALGCNPGETSCLYEALGKGSLSAEQSEVVVVFSKVATPPSDLTVGIEGTGAGEVTSLGTFAELEGEPPIACSYASPGPATGTCKDEMTYSEEEGIEGIDLKANPPAGSEVAEWRIENGSGSFALGCNPGETSCLYEALGKGSLSAEQSEVVVVFSKVATPSYKLNLSTSGSGSGTFECNSGSGYGSCAAEYNEGTVVKVKANPTVGSKFEQWTGECSGNGTCEVTMSQARDVGAEFTKILSYKLNLSTSGTGSGTFKCKVNAGPEETCAPEYEEGKSVEVLQKAAAGSKFEEWTGECSAKGTCVVSMTAARTVGAKFNLILSYKLNLSTSGTGSGSFECNTGSGNEPCKSEYTEGTKVKVLEKVAAGSEFVEWTGECSGHGTCEVTMSQERSVGAVFNKILVYGPTDEPEVEGKVPTTTELNSSECDVNKVNLGEFKPGKPANYPGTCDVWVTATGAENTLTASDESPACPGHLIQGSYALAKALEVKATDTEGLGGTGPGLTPLGSNPPAFSENPYKYPCNSISEHVTVLTYPTPVSDDDVLVEFNQPIAVHDPLHTGKYGKVITLTLAQTKL